MKITRQIVTPNQFEIIDDDGKVLSCHDTNEIALAAMAKVATDRSSRSTTKVEGFIPTTVMPNLVAEAIATAREIKLQQKREG
jgi:hypothetical protein